MTWDVVLEPTVCFRFIHLDHPFSTCAKFTNISCPLTRARLCACQGVRNVSFSKNYPSHCVFALKLLSMAY